MWGKLEQLNDDSADTRNIPTHVGKTILLLCQYHIKRKHPHTRGENHVYVKTKLQYSETSPHTWGKH